MNNTLTKTLTGSQIIIQTLKSLGVDSIFGYPGGIVLGVYDELSKQDDIKHYLVRHEQAAIHSAEGYARVSGKCGVVLVTSGPGATNIITGLANAYLDGFPLVVITGQVSAELLHKSAFQEVDIIDMTKSCTKKNFQVKDIKCLQNTLEQAFSVAMSGKKGPVLVDITKNVFSQDVEFLENSFEIENQNFKGSIDSAIELLKTAERPVIIAGGGACAASKELRKFAEMTSVPVVSTMMGLGAYPSGGTNYSGMIGIFGNANDVVRNSDLVFAIGTRFNDRISCCFKDDELAKKLIHIDINENEISKVAKASVGLVGDAKEILSEMLLKCDYKADISWFAQVSKFNDYKIPLKRSNNLYSFEVMQEISDFLKNKNLTVTTEVGQHQVWAARYLKFNQPYKFLTSGGLGTMGFGFPAAIGASVALNREPVVCIAGDGSFQMNLQELATCVDYKLPVKIFILNNGYLGMVRQFQEKMCDERYFATKISNPDFVKLSESYGIKAFRVEKKTDIKNVLEKAFFIEEPVVVDFIIEPMELL